MKSKCSQKQVDGQKGIVYDIVAPEIEKYSEKFATPLQRSFKKSDNVTLPTLFTSAITLPNIKIIKKLPAQDAEVDVEESYKTARRASEIDEKK